MGRSVWRVIEWDDPRGDIGWAVIDQDGRVVSKHMTRLSAVAVAECSDIARSAGRWPDGNRLGGERVKDRDDG